MNTLGKGKHQTGNLRCWAWTPLLSLWEVATVSGWGTSFHSPWVFTMARNRLDREEPQENVTQWLSCSRHHCRTCVIPEHHVQIYSLGGLCVPSPTQNSRLVTAEQVQHFGLEQDCPQWTMDMKYACYCFCWENKLLIEYDVSICSLRWESTQVSMILGLFMVLQENTQIFIYNTDLGVFMGKVSGLLITGLNDSLSTNMHQGVELTKYPLSMGNNFKDAATPLPLRNS